MKKQKVFEKVDDVNDASHFQISAGGITTRYRETEKYVLSEKELVEVLKDAHSAGVFHGSFNDFLASKAIPVTDQSK